MRNLILIPLVCVASPSAADNLYGKGNWPALAADRRAEQVGDTITVIVAENQQASNVVSSGSRKRHAIDGELKAGSSFDKSAGVGLGGTYDGRGESGRSDRVLAQLSATVSEVLPNGDLQVVGSQRLKINGQTSIFKVSGRVRREDIANDNTVLSSRIADAVIDYNGKGFASDSAKPGIVTRIFSFLGLL